MNLLGCKTLQWNTEDWHEYILRKAELNMDYNCYVLDVGCGDGEDCKLISPCVNFVVGIDVCLNSHRLPRMANLDFIVADARNLPFTNDAFNVVLEKDALHHIAAPEMALGVMVRWVRLN